MPLDPSTFLLLAAQCAPSVAPSTLLAIAQVESGLNPLAIGVNGPMPRTAPAGSAREAVRRAEALVAAGQDFDLGLAQINIRNLRRLDLDLKAAFEPCRNLAAAARVLTEGYQRGAARSGPGQTALRTALSYYNTGHAERGIRNGYVAKVETAARVRSSPTPPLRATPTPAPAEPPKDPSWDVFARSKPVGRAASFVISTPGAAS